MQRLQLSQLVAIVAVAGVLQLREGKMDVGGSSCCGCWLLRLLATVAVAGVLELREGKMDVGGSSCRCRSCNWWPLRM